MENPDQEIWVSSTYGHRIYPIRAVPLPDLDWTGDPSSIRDHFLVKDPLPPRPRPKSKPTKPSRQPSADLQAIMSDILGDL